MKKILLTSLMIFSSSLTFSKTFEIFQTENIHNKLRLNTLTGEIYQLQSDGQKFIVQKPISKPNGERYSLHKTENMWTYILLDEVQGKLWQCQYSIKGDDYRFCKVINSKPLSTSKSTKFTIEPMTSMFQYYLTNQENGEMWQFQWSNKNEEGYTWIKKY